jgi:hypothetical protein
MSTPRLLDDSTRSIVAALLAVGGVDAVFDAVGWDTTRWWAAAPFAAGLEVARRYMLLRHSRERIDR